MDEDESLRRYGLHPVGAQLDEVRALLAEQTEREHPSRGEGDTELMRLCCVQLFHGGDLDDTLLIGRAKQAGFDAACSIEAELLLGHGLEATKAHLAAHPAPDAAAALHRLRELEAEGWFEDFSVRAQAAGYARYYAGE